MLFRVQGRAKTWIALLFAALALFLFVLATSWGVQLFPRWFGLLGGAVLMLLAGLCYWGGTRFSFLYLLTFLLNTFGCGFCAAAYYRVADVPCTLEALLPAVWLPLLLLFLGCLALTAFPDTKEPIIFVAVALEVALLIASVVFWIIRGGEFYAFSLFSHLMAIFYTAVYGLTVKEDERALEHDLATGSFGVFALVGVAALIAVLIVSGGDGCDCDCTDGCECDCCDCVGGDSPMGNNSKKRKK